MLKNEAVLISAFTGYLLTNSFSDVHKFCEELLKRPIYTHEFASKKLEEEIREKCRPMIVEMVERETDRNHWTVYPDEYGICASEFVCSSCKESFVSGEMTDKEFLEMMKYCPNCGAKMCEVKGQEQK